MFGNKPITIRNFRKEMKILIARAVAERLVRFLSILTKNLALLQALEPVFEYILAEQLLLDERTQRHIIIAEQLAFKLYLEEYEHVARLNTYHKYPKMFTKGYIARCEKINIQIKEYIL